MGSSSDSDNSQVWIVGKTVGSYLDHTIWEFGGVFSTEDAARNACHSDNYFIGPAALNELIPETFEAWPEAYYPNTE